eukprot:2265140-Prymnesium_polylepis.1
MPRHLCSQGRADLRTRSQSPNDGESEPVRHLRLHAARQARRAAGNFFQIILLRAGAANAL